ncbi:hypothetical protein CKA32_002928 [Geitlerinema sp. FC II]|nr:hypothetical protein CKA32_002928 [Geitlerinema sp. FC II]
MANVEIQTGFRAIDLFIAQVSIGFVSMGDRRTFELEFFKKNSKKLKYLYF